MPRTCLACFHAERGAIDKALVTGETFRNIAKRFAISPAALFRHKSHVSHAIVKAGERRAELLGDNLLDEMRRVQRKAWELLARTESEGEHRGSIVALREVRECIKSLGEMLSRAAETDTTEVIVNIGVEKCKRGEYIVRPHVAEAAATGAPKQQPTEPPAASQAALPPSPSATEAPRRPRPAIGAVGYLQGLR